MNTLDIEIVAIKVEEVPNSKGKNYTQMTVTHKDLRTGKLDGKKLVEFYTDKTLWNTFLNSKAGDTFSVEREKNDKGYWDWKAASRQDAPPAQQSAPEAPRAAAARNTYEVNNEINLKRFEFDKEKQPLIVRQSVLASAATVTAGAGDPGLTLDVAEQFYNWVMKADKGTITDLTDDIPF